MKKQENIIHTQKKQSKETNLKMTQMLQLEEKDFKTAIINFYKDLKEDKFIMNEQICGLNKHIENIKTNQMEIPKLKNTISKIKNSLCGFSSRLEAVGKINIMNLNIS